MTPEVFCADAFTAFVTPDDLSRCNSWHGRVSTQLFSLAKHCPDGVEI